jgi:hypothetical protein
MAALELTHEEAGALLEILRSYLSDLRLEIGDTKKLAFREDLKKREAFIKKVIERLEAV